MIAQETQDSRKIRARFAQFLPTLYKVPTILAMEGTTSSRRTMDAETLATEGGGADQEVEGESCCVI